MTGGEVREPPGTHIADPGKEARSASGIPVVPVFDGYRALAIFGVVLLHLLILSGVVSTGDDGLIARLTWGTIGHAIDVLFVVSGFVVFLPTAARGGSFGRVLPYAIRRAARLLPAYWLALLLTWILILSTTITPDVASPGLREIAFHLAGLQVPANIAFADVVPGLGVNPPLWTLSVEVGFYVVLPFIAGIYFRHPLAGLAVAALITVGWNWSFENLADLNTTFGLDLSGPETLRQSLGSTLQLPSWAFSFGLGMTGAWAYLKFRTVAATDRGRSVMRFVLAGAVAGFVLFAFLAGGYSDQVDVNLVAQYSRFSPEIAIGYSGFLALLMVSLALAPPSVKRPLENRRLRQLGDISYGIYLCHMVLAVYLGSLLVLPEDGSPGALALWTLAVVPASVLYGYLSARFLEQPVRRWARQFGYRRSPDNKAG